MSVTQDYKKPLLSRLLSRILQRRNDTVKEAIERWVGAVRLNVKRQFVEVSKGGEEVSLLSRFERRANLIAKIAGQEAEFMAEVGAERVLGSFEFSVRKFSVSELAAIGRHGTVSFGKKSKPNTRVIGGTK